MKKYLYVSVLIFLTQLCLSFPSYASTPNHVYQAAEDLHANITKLRKATNVESDIRLVGVQIAKTPIHAYTKALEVFEKIQRLKDLRKLPVVPQPDLPNTQVTPADVLSLLDLVNEQLLTIAKQLNIEFSYDATLPVGKTPSDVYELLWNISYLMDGFVPSISPNYVYRNTQRIESAINVIAQHLKVTMNVDTPETLSGQKPIDANIEGFKVLYKMVELEEQLNIPPVRVPGFPSGNITPSDVYDTTNNIIAEITRINITLGLPAIPNLSVPSEKMTPSDVVRQFKKIQLLMSNILAKG